MTDHSDHDNEDAAGDGEATGDGEAAGDAPPTEDAKTSVLGTSPGGELDPEWLARRLRAGEEVSVLDVRDRPEFERWRIDGTGVTARQVPHVKFIAAGARGDATEPLPDDLAEPLVVVCGRGAASADVAGDLADAGVDAVNLAGGMDAWADLALTEQLVDADDVTVLQYQRPASGCLAYLVVAGDGDDREAAVIDPLRAFAERYAADAADRGATLRYAIDTHVHADHVSGIRAVREATAAEAVLPAGAVDRGLDFPATLVGDGDVLRVGDAELEAIHAPGHTSELNCIRLRRTPEAADSGDADVLFTGDALFLQSVGRPDLEAGEAGARELATRAYDTLHDRLLALPGDTLVAPGHFADFADARGDGYAAPLSTLRDLDVLTLDREAFLERVGGSLPPRPANYERIVAANLGTATLTDVEAFEAELGPNNCAVSAD